MSSGRSLQHQLVVCLILAGLLFRGMIPAGFMPATGEAARHGALLMLCLHGERVLRDHGGKHPGGVSLVQCPFGAAAAPSLPGVALVFHLPPDLAYPAPARITTHNYGASPRLQPPARAPPLLS